MKKGAITLLLAVATSFGLRGQISSDYPYQPVAFTKVNLTDNFWMPRLKVNKEVTIPFAFEKCENTNRMKNFELAAKVLRGESKGEQFLTVFPFDDTDIYKVIEGASYSLHTHYDAKLDKYIHDLLALVKSAQEPDGYLYTFRSMNPPKPHSWSGTERWVNDRLKVSHELYNSGHFFEAAVAHYEATGKRTMLDMAIKNADLIYNTIGKDKLRVVPGHQVIEMGLVKLYRVTGEKRYLELADYFVNDRGRIQPVGSAYNQDHKPVVMQDEAVGHAVRAGYYYAGVADVAALTGNKDYLNAIDKIWENVVNKKFYITGGIGARHDGEAFGDNYELPNLTAYNETCAAIANVFWNHRMFLLHGDAKYIDVMERSLYNNVISGIGLDGKTFFYPNPLECDMQFKFNSGGTLGRQPWFDCSCCPSNDVRIIASLPGYIYAVKGNELFANLFVAGKADIEISGNKLSVEQVTNYPWDGNVTFVVNPQKQGDFVLNLRIPGWAVNQVLPGDLYAFTEKSSLKPTIKVNGKEISFTTDKGYAKIQRKWKAGDKVELNLPMPVRRVVANKNVKDDINRVSFIRGPITYCAEEIDNKINVLQAVIPDDAKFNEEFRKDILNGATFIKTKGYSYKNVNGSLEKVEGDFTLVPYCLWNNRDLGKMNVWFYDKNYVFKPEITTGSAIFKDKSSVELTAPKDCQIFYTVDGSQPSAGSLKYSKPFDINGTTEIKAISVNAVGSASEVSMVKLVKADYLPLSKISELQPGAKYEYYEMDKIRKISGFDGATPVATGVTENFDIHKLAKRPDFYQLSFTGYLKISKPGNYTFELESDDGSMLWIEGAEMINNDGTHGVMNVKREITLDEGLYKFRLAFFEYDNGEALRFLVSGPGLVRQLIPKEMIYSK